MSILVNGEDLETGRVFVASYVLGNTPEELEADALDQARAFFGEEPRLVLSRLYNVTQVTYGSMLSRRTDKKYITSIQVYEVLP